MSVSSRLTIMQCAYFLAVLVSLAVAEQPSLSYLPPSPTSSYNGYAQGAQVVDARSSVQGNSVNGFARSSNSEYRSAARSQSQGYEDSAAFARNSNESNPREERIQEKVQGQYHVVLSYGRRQTVNYEADERGFKPQESYEGSEDLARSVGYNSNTNTRNYGNYKNGGRNARGY